MNLTLGIMGLFLMLDPQQIKQSYLRIVTYSLPITWFYDLLWIIYKSKEYWEDREDRGMS